MPKGCEGRGIIIPRDVLRNADRLDARGKNPERGVVPREEAEAMGDAVVKAMGEGRRKMAPYCLESPFMV